MKKKNRWAQDRSFEKTQVEKQKEKRLKENEESLWEFWDVIKRNNIHNEGVPEQVKKKKGAEGLFKEVIIENFLTQDREMDIQTMKPKESQID